MEQVNLLILENCQGDAGPDTYGDEKGSISLVSVDVCDEDESISVADLQETGYKPTSTTPELSGKSKSFRPNLYRHSNTDAVPEQAAIALIHVPQP